MGDTERAQEDLRLAWEYTDDTDLRAQIEEALEKLQPKDTN
jgi:hypothetical protein